MIAVIFEVIPKQAGKAEYLAIAAKLREHLADIPGFISIERFQSLSDPDKILSLSFWARRGRGDPMAKPGATPYGPGERTRQPVQGLPDSRRQHNS